MFRIRRVHAIRSPADRNALEACQRILSAQFVLLNAAEIAELPEVMRDPVTYGFKAVLLVADDARGKVLGFALGLDTARSDPTGTWNLTARDLDANGALIGRLGRPTLVIQEGGYRVRSLGTNARAFFEGLVRGAFR